MIQADKVIKTGYITDLDTGKVYHLGGLNVRNNCIFGGCGWALAIDYDDEYTVSYTLIEGRHWSHHTVERNELVKRKILDNFKYEGNEKLHGN